jgi:hypothetical protein
MTSNSEARKRRDEREAEVASNGKFTDPDNMQTQATHDPTPASDALGQRDGTQSHLVPSFVTITISREDADYMVEGEWIDERLRRIADAMRAALEGKR